MNEIITGFLGVILGGIVTLACTILINRIQHKRQMEVLLLEEKKTAYFEMLEYVMDICQIGFADAHGRENPFLRSKIIKVKMKIYATSEIYNTYLKIEEEIKQHQIEETICDDIICMIQNELTSIK